MPTVVYPNSNDPLSGFIDAVSGVTQGLTAVNQYDNANRIDNANRQVDVRKAEQELAQRKDEHVDAQSLSLMQLQLAKNEGKLTREQERRLFTAQARIEAAKQQRNIEQSQREAELQYGSSVYATKKGYDASVYASRVSDTANKREYALRKQQLNDKTNELAALGTAREKYGQPGDPTYNEDAIVNDVMEATGIPGETTGADGVPQLPPEKIAERRAQILAGYNAYDDNFKRLTKEREEMAMAESVDKRTGGKGYSGKTKGLEAVDFLDSKKKDNLTDGYSMPIKYQGDDGRPTILSHYKDDFDGLDGTLIALVNTYAQHPDENLGKQFLYSYRDSVNGVLDNTVLDDATKKNLERYFMGRADTLFGNVTSMSASGPGTVSVDKNQGIIVNGMSGQEDDGRLDGGRAGGGG